MRFEGRIEGAFWLHPRTLGPEPRRLKVANLTQPRFTYNGLLLVAGIWRSRFKNYCCLPSRNGFSRDRMPGDSAAEFDAAVREMLRPWTQNDRIECALIGTVILGRATKSPHA
jgi:hypothetical protein